MDAKQVFSLMGRARGDQRECRIDGAALPSAVMIYSQGGEDWAICKRLKHHAPPYTGFYVDIGCGKPHEISNSYLFYTFGWSGLCIDANDDHAAAWATHRPRDKFICQAVGKENGTATLFKSAGPNWGIAAIGDAPPAPSGFKRGRPVPIRRLDEILAEHVGDRSIDFMTIDVEASEEGVLVSNNWDRWKPEVIVIECRGFSFDAPADLPAVRLILNQGYTLQDKIGENLLFTRNVPVP